MKPQVQRPVKVKVKKKPKPSYAATGSTPAKKGGYMQWIIIGIVMLACCGAGALIYNLLIGKGKEVIEVKNPQTTTAEALELLSATDLTLQRIQEIEKDVKHNGSDKEEADLKSRILALRHIYMECLQNKQHSVKALYNTYVIHSGEFSKQQRDLMIWYFDQPENVKMRWESTSTMPKSLDEFKQIIEQGK